MKELSEREAQTALATPVLSYIHLYEFFFFHSSSIQCNDFYQRLLLYFIMIVRV